MKLLLTNDELHEVRGGTQVFIAELAQSLRERGHGLAVCSWLRGSLAEELKEAGVPVVGNPRDCGFVPDVIHAQHHLAALTALCAFPGVPAIYHCHGYSPWQERPPVHPRILHYVTNSESMTGWIADTTGCKKDKVIILRNSINLGRFQRVRSPGLHPRRALLFGNNPIPSESISKLTRACRRGGLTLDLVGAQFNNATSAPQDLLPQYDIVFAIGRSALEAAACGCAVIVFSAVGCGPMIRPQNLRAFMNLNFTLPEPARSPPVKEVVTRIGEFDAGHAAAVTAIVRGEFDFERSCDQLEELYQGTVDEWRSKPPPTAEDESLALSIYLAGLGPYIKGADARFAAVRSARDKSKQRISRLQQKVVALEASLDLIRRRLPGLLRRWLLREP